MESYKCSFELQEHRNTIFAASEVLGGELQTFFELQEHRNTIFAASEVPGGEPQMFFELQEHRNTIFAASEVLGGELQMFFELQEHRIMLLCKIPEIEHPGFLLQNFSSLRLLQGKRNATTLNDIVETITLQFVDG